MTMSVFHHPCGKREVLFPFEACQPCAACARLRTANMQTVIAQTKAQMAAALRDRKVTAKRKPQP